MQFSSIAVVDAILLSTVALCAPVEHLKRAGQGLYLTVVTDPGNLSMCCAVQVNDIYRCTGVSNCLAKGTCSAIGGMDIRASVCDSAAVSVDFEGSSSYLRFSNNDSQDADCPILDNGSGTGCNPFAG